MTLNLITYADAKFRRNAERLVNSAIDVGFSHARCVGPQDLQGTTFARNNADVLSRERGAGFWIWKPYIILTELHRAKPNQCILYSDAGRTGYYKFTRYPRRLEHVARTNGKGYVLGASVPHLGTIQQWTKRDCLVLMQADRQDILNKPLIMTWSLWTKTDAAIAFLEEWLAACLDRRCLTDDPNTCGLPNYPEFKDHRHDQSIMSILAYKARAPFFDLRRSVVQRLIELRPGAAVSHQFYKRPQNVDDVLRHDNPYILFREFVRSKYYDASKRPAPASR